VAPVLPVEQLGAIRWLAAKHLAVVDRRFEPNAPPANMSTSNGTLAPVAPGPRTDLLGMVRSVFHIQEVVLYSSTHVDFHTEGGRRIEIKQGDATLVDPQGGVRRSLCVANVSCASFSVDADEAEGFHEAALRALIAGGFEIDEDIRALPIVRRLLLGPLAAELAEAEGAGRRLQLGVTAPLCTNTCDSSTGGSNTPSPYANNGFCEDGGEGSWQTARRCMLGTDCADCTPLNARTTDDFDVMGVQWKQDLFATGSGGLRCDVQTARAGETARAVPETSPFGPYYSCMVNLDQTSGRGSATFTLNSIWASYAAFSDWAPKSVWMTYSESAQMNQYYWGFDGGTLIERECAAGEFQGMCKIAYHYLDNRGLSQQSGDGVYGRTTFELIWSCFGTTLEQNRMCQITSGMAYYMVEAKYARGEGAHVNWYDRWQRKWRFALPSDGSGSVKLPAFRSCDSTCNCATFPQLVWDVTNQRWNEDTSSSQSCSNQEAVMAAETTCWGASFDRVSRPFIDDDRESRHFELTAGNLYGDYHALHSFANPDVIPVTEPNREAVLQERRDDIWVTLGLFQRKYFPLPECAQPGHSGTIYQFVTAGSIFQSIDWPNMFNDAEPGFNYGIFANSNRLGSTAPSPPSAPPPSAFSNCIHPPNNYIVALGRRLNPAEEAAPAEEEDEEGARRDPVSSLPLSRRELGRGVGSGSAGAGRLQGCARHATCATRGRRAPPRRP